MPLLRIFLLSILLAPLWSHAAGNVVLLELKGPIGPATSDFVLQGLEDAQTSGADLVVLRMDTPGGLDTSMRDIIRAILGSSVPVATYVAPGGSRAASAGTYILYASHIAVMAPATNLGAATPVQIGGLPTPGGQPPDEEKPAKDQPKDQDKDKGADTEKTNGEPQQESEPTTDTAPKTAMERKLINDARAYIRSLAQLRERNVEWAEQAVTEAASLSAQEALDKGVIDIVAVDVQDLLRQAHGRTVQLAGQEHTLTTTDATVEVVKPDWRNRLLAVITNPQVAYILMLIGIYGIFFELSNPGAMVPGVLGGICLLLALFAFQVLPINYAGLALIILGLAFMIAEAFVPSFGILGLGGVAAFIIGSFILWDETGPGYEIPIGIIFGFALASAMVLIGIGTMLVRQRRRPVTTGREEMLSATGVVLDDFEDKGWVRVHSESWRARSDRPVKKGERVRVVDQDGLTLSVQPLDKGEEKS